MLATLSLRKETVEKHVWHSGALCCGGGRAHTDPLKLTSASSDEIHDEGCSGSCLALEYRGSQIPFGSNCPISELTIMADWASGKASSPLLNVEDRLEGYWFGPFPPNCQETVSTHLEIDGRALQQGYGLWISRSHLNLSLTGATVQFLLPCCPSLRFGEMVNYSSFW